MVIIALTPKPIHPTLSEFVEARNSSMDISGSYGVNVCGYEKYKDDKLLSLLFGALQC